jgi:hypothetical protein
MGVRMLRTVSWSMGLLAAAAVVLAVPAETPVQPPGVYAEGTADAKGRVPVEKIATAAMLRAGTKDLAKGMIGGALTGGLLGKPKVALVYAGARSSVRLASQPMFQFHFDPKAAEAPPAPPARPTDMASMMAAMEGAQGGGGEMEGARRPHEFALVKLEVKNDERVLVAAMDMKPVKPIACRVRQLGPAAWRVAPEKPLPPGEYAFFVVPRQGGGGSQRIWEFGVDDGGSASR